MFATGSASGVLDPVRARWSLTLAAVCSLVGAGPVRAQEREPVRLSATPENGELTIEIGSLLEGGNLARALHSGLPLRIRMVAELWKDGFFDSQVGRAEWRALVLYDPLERRYRVAVGARGDAEASLETLQEVSRALEEGFQMPVRPSESGRYYYLGTLEVQTLSLSDLEELSRWLRGDLAAAVAGERQMDQAVGRGLARMLVRMLGMPTERVRVRTEKFDVRLEVTL